METDALIRQIVDAHGGERFWNSLDSLTGTISAAGFLFTAKKRKVLDHTRISLSTRQPSFVFYDFPSKGINSEWIGDKEVRITSSSGEVISQRSEPRKAFGDLKHFFAWDDLDFTYFAGYATWNYLVTPFLFLRQGFRVEVMAAPKEHPSWTRLRVAFPEDVPTHSPVQDFYFDEKKLLRRLDYTAEVVGGWAHAAHFCESYKDFGGIRVPTRRHVVPTLGSMVLPGPVLVKIEVHDLKPVTGK